MAKVWEIGYKGHRIRVENRWFSERLMVDGELQDEQMGYAHRSRLFGSIKSGEGQGELIKVSAGGTWTIACRIFIDDRLVFSEG